jgi:26S proteasome regulatory subunit N12
MEGAHQLMKKLKDQWNKSSHNLQEISRLLQQMKVVVLELSYLPIDSGEAERDARPLVIARDMLEIGAFWSIEAGEMSQFEYYMAQLKTYYFDYASVMEKFESVFMATLLGLNLMYLLSENRLAEFHAELERLPPSYIETNVYIIYPVKLEQNLMEGSYQKIFMLKESIPDPYYQFFVNKLLSAIKDEIASCAEVAYRHLSLEEVRDVLQLSSLDEALQYTTARKWTMEGSNFVFRQVSEQVDGVTAQSSSLLTQSLNYAKELEKIV